MPPLLAGWAEFSFTGTPIALAQARLISPSLLAGPPSATTASTLLPFVVPERGRALRSGHRPKPWRREVLGRLGNGLLARWIGAADFVEVVVPIESTASTRASPLCRYARIILRARRAAIVHVLSLTFLSNVVAYVCRAPPGQDRRHARLPRQSPAAPSLGDTARGRA
jgi:hypothetical protein